MHLNAEINWHLEFEKLIKGLIKEIANEQKNNNSIFLRFMNILFVLITAFIAWHGLTFRDKEGNKDIVRLLFGAISLLFCLRVLLW